MDVRFLEMLEETEEFRAAWLDAGRSLKDLLWDGVGVRKEEAFEVEKVDEEKMTVRNVISSDRTDRVGDVIVQEGWDFKNFVKAGGSVLFGHDYHRPAVARGTDLEVQKGKTFTRTVALTEFAPTKLGKELFTLYSKEFMKMFSVGFRPKGYEIIENDKGQFTGFKFTKSELLEYSCVPVGCNTDALTLALEKGFITERTARLLHVAAPVGAPGANASNPPPVSADALAELRSAHTSLLVYQATRRTRETT